MVTLTGNGLPDLAATGKNFSGAMAVLNVGRFITFSRIITNHVAGSGQFNYPTNGPILLQQPFMWTAFYKGAQRYYLECHLNCLDTAGEWYYRPATRELFFWAPGGGPPAGDLRGKTATYAFDLNGANNLTLEGLNFFGATFRLLNGAFCTVQDCAFDHYACSRRMLGVEDDLVTNGMTQLLGDTQMNGPSGSCNTIRNCTFGYNDGSALVVQGQYDLVENVQMHDIDWSGQGGFTCNVIGTRDSIVRRLTAWNAGSSECVMVGAESLVELCDLGQQLGALQGDGACVQVFSALQNGVEVRHCWVHDNNKFGIRADYDGENVVYPQGYGTNMLVHHNVTWGMTGVGESPAIHMEGDCHRVLNNLSFSNLTRDICLTSPDNLGNTHTVTRNNLTGPCGIGVDRMMNCQDSPPGTADHNWLGDVRTQVIDFDSRDFRPRLGSAVVDAGLPVAGVTDGYLGTAPDIGAYEFGDCNYWIPGYQTAQAMPHVPTNGATVNTTNVDLVWLGGYQGVSYDVYCGDNLLSVADANHGSPEFKQNQTNNIFTVTGLITNRAYYWRVDTIKSDGSLVLGGTSAFSTQAPLIINGSFESPTIDEAIAAGSPGLSGIWADNVSLNGWLGMAGVNKLMVVDGNQNLYWNDPQGKSIAQTLGTTVSGETGGTYTVQYTRQIIAQPSIKNLRFTAELLIGGQVVDIEQYTNVSVPAALHQLRYTNDGSRIGQSITIRFSADSDEGWTGASQIQSVFLDNVQVSSIPPLRLMVALAAGRIEFQWCSWIGATYALECAPSVAGPWQTCMPGLPATPPTNSLLVPLDRSSASVFYRLRLD